MSLARGKAGSTGIRAWFSLAASCLLMSLMASAETSPWSLHFSPVETKIAFTLGDSLHTIHGSFRLKSGEVTFDPNTGATHGLIVVDATSGQSGSRIRDRRMHREILQTARYPEIIFRPDRVEGKISTAGASSVQVHGIFSIHGADHEITLPARVQASRDRWILDLHFTIPYVKWGIKNPSTFLLRVSESVEIDVHATGGSLSRARPRVEAMSGKSFPLPLPPSPEAFVYSAH
jgi:polyisoprenoid-binding protein YceI